MRITGGPLLTTTVYKTEKLRCNLCLTVFEAALPPGVRDTPRYDNRALAIMVLSKYFLATPFNRSREFQANLGIPLPASTCAEKVFLAWQMLGPLFLYLSYQAAQADKIGFDDTRIKVLSFMKENQDRKDDPEFRRGYHTSVFVASTGELKVVLFRTGRQHAGENYRDLLAMREEGLKAPLAVSDGLECYFPHKATSIDVRCSSHARRKFYELEKVHPVLHEKALDLFGAIYKNNADAIKLSPEERLAHHREHSRRPLNELVDLVENEAEKLEPSSDEFKACDYLIKNWNQITSFMRIPGAPLDTNEEERMAKQVIKVRKSSLFFKTAQGAHMGDDFMGLIETCRANDVNVFDYLVWALDNHNELPRAPMNFTPWDFKRQGASPPESRPPKGSHLREGPVAWHSSATSPPRETVATT